MRDSQDLPVHNPMTTSTTWIEVGGRRGGLTTIMVDIAIMNARAGAKVQLWSRNWPEADKAARIAVDRLQVTDTAPARTKFGQPGGVQTVMFPNGGRIEFRGLTNSPNADIERPGIDFSLYDAGGQGKVVRHHADVHHR